MSNTNPRILGMSPGVARWVLSLSLVVNFLLVGMAGGAAWRMMDEPHHGKRFHFTRHVIEAAGPDRREEVRALLKRTPGQKWRANMKAWMAKTADLLEAIPFDPAALTAEMQAAESDRTTARAERSARLVEALSLLTDAERKTLAEDIRAHMNRGKK